MQFDSFSEFFAMGGHGLYVWLAYGATLAVLVSSTAALRLARRKHLRQLRWTLQVQTPEMGRACESAAGADQTDRDTGMDKGTAGPAGQTSREA
jgi:heme exporter protein D